MFGGGVGTGTFCHAARAAAPALSFDFVNNSSFSLVLLKHHSFATKISPAARRDTRHKSTMRSSMMVASALLTAFVASADFQRPCDGKDYAWCDASKDFKTRVDLLVSNLTVEEKSVLFVNGAGSVDRIGWPAYNWWSEALHGVARDGVATSFPQICGVAASYNRSLWNQIGQVTSTEGRGKNNEYSGKQYDGLTFWAPNVNIFRDPRWGRGQETPGEDPTMNGEYAVEFVTGMQGDDDKYVKVSACLKHYAAYSEETDRLEFPAVVTSQDMEDTYLPAFQAGVEKGKATSIMCSYNAETYGEGIYGEGTQGGAIPSCANKGILNDLARDKWGFDGYITSDCGAVSGVQNKHKYTKNNEETVKATLTAGMDIDCGGYMNGGTMKTVYSDADIAKLADDALKNLFMVQFRLGFADPVDQQPEWIKYDDSVVNTQANQALAREAADQSLVLLKNDGNALPWEAKSGMKLAVMGREANATTNMQGNYFGDAPFLISPAMGIGAYGDVTYTDGKDVAASVKAVEGKDAVVLVVGLNSEGAKPADEAEGKDRTSLLLPDNQDDFVAQVAAAAAAQKISVTVVLMSGSPLDVSAIKANANVSAIIWCGYPGQSGGAAIADALFGKTNPSGKLSVTWYPEDFAQKVGIKDMGMRPNKTTGNPGRSYRFYTGTPVFKFGEGLSYSTFDSAVVRAPERVAVESFPGDLSLSALSKAAVARVTVNTTNLSERDGAESILVFAASPNAGRNGEPIQSLVAFDKIHVPAGTHKLTELEITAQHFALASVSGERAVTRGPWKVWVGIDGQDKAVEILVA